jgi:hypothetical protein
VGESSVIGKPGSAASQCTLQSRVLNGYGIRASMAPKACASRMALAHLPRRWRYSTGNELPFDAVQVKIPGSFEPDRRVRAVKVCYELKRS